jgi:VanZ family protein
VESLSLVVRQIAFVALVAFVAYGLYLELRGELSEGLLWGLVSVFVIADVVLSLLPTSEASDPLNTRDKLVHMLAYGVLVLLLLFALVWRPTRGYGRWPEAAAAVLFGVLAFGAALELLQLLVGRDASMPDVVANAIGGIAGLYLWRRIALGTVGVPRAPALALYDGGAGESSSNAAPGPTGVRPDAAGPPRRAELEALAFVLMPAEQSLKALLVEADCRWRSGRWRFDTDYAVWGRSWLATSKPLARALRFAIDRERALWRLRRRPAGGLHVVAVHRLHPPMRSGAGLRRGMRQTLLGGALVELSRVQDVLRVIDVVACAAGERDRMARIRRGSGGAAVALIRRHDGEPAVLRVARLGSSGDPARGGNALRYMAHAEVDEVPRLIASGCNAGASWTLESFIVGAQPRRARSGLIADVGRVLARLPRTDSPPHAPADDLRLLGRFLPQHADVFSAAAGLLDNVLWRLPSVMRHGDLWVSNLLVRKGRLVGILDWDAWHPLGVPGTDLLYLFVTEKWRHSTVALGDLWGERPWCAPAFLNWATPYWDALGVRTDARILEAIGVAAWSAQVASNLMRLPQLVDNERWMGSNADKLVSYLRRMP